MYNLINNPGIVAAFCVVVIFMLFLDLGIFNKKNHIVSDKDAAWLYAKIKGDGEIDAIEKRLLLNLKNKAKSFPANLESLLS
jgi:hypothetical protein